MQTTNTIRRDPLLIYDGDCRFCIYWARYWQRLTGHRVTYAPYQEVAAQYPKIPLAAFQRAVQYVPPMGRSRAAPKPAAVFTSRAAVFTSRASAAKSTHAADVDAPEPQVQRPCCALH
jgi:hypothetical protein